MNINNTINTNSDAWSFSKSVYSCFSLTYLFTEELWATLAPKIWQLMAPDTSFNGGLMHLLHMATIKSGGKCHSETYRGSFQHRSSEKQKSCVSSQTYTCMSVCVLNINRCYHQTLMRLCRCDHNNWSFTKIIAIICICVKESANCIRRCGEENEKKTTVLT